MQAYKTIPQGVKMDLRAFWRVVAMVCGISVCHSDRRPGLVASQFCYMRYITVCRTHVRKNIRSAERMFRSKTVPKNERKIRRGKVPCGFNFVRYSQKQLASRLFHAVKFYNLKN